MEFVINEWYLDWHNPKISTPEEQSKARIFLQWLQNNQHRIVVLVNTNFTQKLNDYRRDFSFHPMCSIYLKLFFSQIFINPDKCRILDESSSLPADIEEKLSVGNFVSDRYLFQSAEATEEKIIVTTDTKLMKHFEGNGRYQLWSVEEFMNKFDIK
ncbi:MAG: hypothetical protein EPGJADBJ_00782 [Saprospiraceae bacterium]|nr:hypothetical protein [Saprospiraceae bacterium]